MQSGMQIELRQTLLRAQSKPEIVSVFSKVEIPTPFLRPNLLLGSDQCEVSSNATFRTAGPESPLCQAEEFVRRDIADHREDSFSR